MVALPEGLAGVVSFLFGWVFIMPLKLYYLCPYSFFSFFLNLLRTS